MNNTFIKPYVELAKQLSKVSTCKRRGVAALIISENTLQLAAWGVNGIRYVGAIRQRDDCTGIKDKCGCTHAEVWALESFGITPIGVYSMLTTRAPCSDCAEAIIKHGYVTKMYLPDEPLSESGQSGVDKLRAHGFGIEWY